MPRAHPPEFRRRAVVLARLREKPAAQIADDLGISVSCLRGWLKQADVLTAPFASLTNGGFGPEGRNSISQLP